MQKFLRSFGRTKGHSLTAQEKLLLETLLPSLIPSPHLTNITLEIGFGSGEHLLDLYNHGYSPIIGCEPYINGSVKLLKIISQEDKPGIFIWDKDARDLISELSFQSIQRCFILFPDPWPKKKHHKRRLINGDLMKLLWPRMTSSGTLIIATDHDGYSEWIEGLLSDYNYEKSILNSPQEAKDMMVYTRYCQKALDKGLSIKYFIVKKNSLI